MFNLIYSPSFVFSSNPVHSYSLLRLKVFCSNPVHSYSLFCPTHSVIILFILILSSPSYRGATRKWVAPPPLHNGKKEWQISILVGGGDSLSLRASFIIEILTIFSFLVWRKSLYLPFLYKQKTCKLITYFLWVWRAGKAGGHEPPLFPLPGHILAFSSSGSHEPPLYPLPYHHIWLFRAKLLF